MGAASGFANCRRKTRRPRDGARLVRALGLDRLERARAVRGLDGRAGAVRHILPGVALVIGTRGAGAGGAGAGRAVIVALQRDAVAFVHGGLRRFWRGECRGGDHGEGGGEGAGDGGVGEEVLGTHGKILSGEYRANGVNTAFTIGLPEWPATAGSRQPNLWHYERPAF